MKQEPNHNQQILKKPDYHSIDVNSVEYSEVRHIGAETLGVHAAIQLELEPLLKKLGFNQKKCHLGHGQYYWQTCCSWQRGQHTSLLNRSKCSR